ncbi:hypothetical protein ACVINZ_000060 [Mesorhizobium jarvisii]
MDFTSTKRVRGQSNRASLEDSSRSAPIAGVAAFERQLSEIANSGGGGGAVPAGSAPQPPQFVKRLSKRPLHAVDSESISALEAALIKGNAAEYTASTYVGVLRGFGRWLFANNKDPIKDRLDLESLTDDAREFVGKGDPKTLLTAIDHLRTSQSTGGVVPIAARAELIPHPEDVALIHEYKNEVATKTGSTYAGSLRSFSDYLRQNNKKGIAGRLSDGLLNGDVKGYKEDAGGNRNIAYALACLRKSQAGVKAIERARHMFGVMAEQGVSCSAPQQTQSARLGRNQPLYLEDTTLISALGAALIKGNAAKRTASNDISSLLSFGRWLFANNKPPIKDRLDCESLTDNASEFIGKGDLARLLRAIRHLRTAQSTGGIVPIAGRAELAPHPEDAALINQYKDEAQTNTGRSNATVLRSFSDYLHQNNKKGIAGRLSGKALDGDVKSYKEDAGGGPRIGSALTDLRKSQAGVRAMELERRVPLVPIPADAALMEPRRAGEAIAQHSASQEAVSWPKELRTRQDNQPAPSFFIAPGKLPAGPDSLNNIAAGAFGAADARHAGDQAAARPLLALSEQQIRRSPGAPDRGNLLPTDWVIINNEHSTALLRPAKRQRKLNAPPAVAIQLQLNGIANSGGCMPMQPSAYQVGALPLEEQLVVRGRESEYIPRLQSEIRGIGGAAAQHSAPHDAIAPRFVVPMEDYDQDLLWEGMNKADSLPSLGSSASHCQPPASAGAVHALNRRHDRHPGADEFAGSSVLPRRKDGGFEAMVHRNPPTPFELNAMVPAPDFPPPFAGPVPAHHHGARQPSVPQELSPVPTSSNGKGLAWLSEELVRRQMQELASLLRAGAQHLYPGSEALVASDPSDLRDDAHFAPGPPPGTRARSGTFDGLQSFVDLNAPTPSDLRDDAHFAPGPPPGTRARSGTFGGLQSFVDLNAPTPSDLRDDAHSAPVRPRKQTLGDTERQTMMQGTEAAAVFGPGGPGDGPLMHRGRLSPMGEAAPATRAKIRQPASPVTTRPGDTYRGLPVVDLTTSTTTSSDTQLGGVGSESLIQCREGIGARARPVARRRAHTEGLQFASRAAAGARSDARRADAAGGSVGIPSTASSRAAIRARHIAVHL